MYRNIYKNSIILRLEYKISILYIFLERDCTIVNRTIHDKVENYKESMYIR